MKGPGCSEGVGIAPTFSSQGSMNEAMEAEVEEAVIPLVAKLEGLMVITHPYTWRQWW